MSSLKLKLALSPSTSLYPQPPILARAALGATGPGSGEKAAAGPTSVLQRSYPTLTLLLIISAVLLFIIAILIVALSIIVLTRLSGHLSELLLTLYLNTIIYSLLALSSFTAVYLFFPRPRRGRSRNTALKLKTKWLHFFSSAYASLFVLSLGISIIFVYLLFQPNSLATLLDTQELQLGNCAPESSPVANMQDTISLLNLCMQSTSVMIWGVSLIVIGWLINIVVIILVGQYARRIPSPTELKLGFASRLKHEHMIRM